MRYICIKKIINSFIDKKIHHNLLFWVTASVAAGAAVAGEQLLCTVLPRLEGLGGINSEKLQEYMTLIMFHVCAS